MSKLCFNYESGEFEEIDRDGYSWTLGEYVTIWDDSPYKRAEEEEEKERQKKEEEEREEEERMRLLYDKDDD